MDVDSEIGKLLGKFVNMFSSWDEYETYYLEKVVPGLVAAPSTGKEHEQRVLYKLQALLTPEQWKVLSSLIREYRAAVEEKEANARQAIVQARDAQVLFESTKQALLIQLRERFEQKFLSAFDFYHSNCSTHISPEEYEDEKLAFVRAWASLHLSSLPDPQQLRAIGAIDGHVQVVARAGSGKTATLINRTLFLQQHCGVAPHEILLLAFNRKAAEEMIERLSKKITGDIPFTMTFHALSYALVHPEGSILFDEPDGTQAKSRVLQSLIDDYRRYTVEGDGKVRSLMMAHFREDWERIVLGRYKESRGDVLQYRRSLVNEGIDGKYFKSGGEKTIGDFLFEHDIPYQYERVFPWVRPYRPDFTINMGPDRGIVIEYFGMQGDLKYDQLSQQKREYWETKPSWTLVELTPDGAEGLRATLRQMLEANGVPCVRLSEDQIWSRIKVRAIERFTKAVVGFVERCRKLSLTPEQLRKIASGHKCISEVEEQFLNLGQEFYKSYLQHLHETGETDFDGLLQDAAERVAAGQTAFLRKSGNGDLRNLRFVFIDEYQDFSALFHRLIESIRAQNSQVQFYCVGDDWQAINGFAGSDLRFYRDFVTVFQPSQRLSITTNYRSAQSIVRAGNALMSQLGISANAARSHIGSVVVADMGMFRSTTEEKVEYGGNFLVSAIVRLVKKVVSMGNEVVLLSQTGFLNGTVLDRFLALVHTHLSQGERTKVSISTVHKFKGLEKHTVIILDATAWRFPLVHPDWVFTRALGNSLERVIDEDRRLLYVALTRAAEQLIIITEMDNVSPFVADLMRQYPLSHLIWSDYPPVVQGRIGVVIEISNQLGRGPNSTIAIKQKLKAEGYAWVPARKYWHRTVSADAFSIEQFIAQASWGSDADGIEVRFREEENQTVFWVNSGCWERKVGMF